MTATILWIEGNRADNPPFVPHLRKKDFTIEIVPTGSAAIERLWEVDPDLVVVNAASLRSSGKRICCALRQQVDGLPIVLITAPEQRFSGEVCANEVLALPFTFRKLVNRILPLLPGEGERSLHVGPIRLDFERKVVRCQGRETHLTPRLTRLLQILMQNPGVVVEREKHFRQVWMTEYLGDTRTLDVHISWLRNAIEENPRQPVFLKTIRGIGYRLDV